MRAWSWRPSRATHGMGGSADEARFVPARSAVRAAPGARPRSRHGLRAPLHRPAGAARARRSPGGQRRRHASRLAAGSCRGVPVELRLAGARAAGRGTRSSSVRATGATTRTGGPHRRRWARASGSSSGPTWRRSSWPSRPCPRAWWRCVRGPADASLAACTGSGSPSSTRTWRPLELARSRRCSPRPWAVEMPSAGRPLSWEVLRACGRAGGVGTLTHAAGLSATGDPSLDAALPFPERYEIPLRTGRCGRRFPPDAAGHVLSRSGTTVCERWKGAPLCARRGPAGRRRDDLTCASGPGTSPAPRTGSWTGVHVPGTSD